MEAVYEEGWHCWALGLELRHWLLRAYRHRAYKCHGISFWSILACLYVKFCCYQTVKTDILLKMWFSSAKPLLKGY